MAFVEKIKAFSLENFSRKYFENSKHKTWNFALFALVVTALARLLTLIFFFLFFDGGMKQYLHVPSFNWDSGWYHSLIEGGYADHPNQHEAGDAANWAFFPLMPIIVRLCSFGGFFDYGVTGYFVNSMIFVFALVVAYKYIMLGNGKASLAVKFAVFMSIGPYSFYFFSLYTESVFMLLTLLFIYNLRQERYMTMGLVGALLSATRVTGVMMVFAVLIYIIQKHIREKQGGFRDFIKNTLSSHRLILGVAVIPLGLFLYMAYLQFKVGDSLAFMHIQKAWGRSGLLAIQSFPLIGLRTGAVNSPIISYIRDNLNDFTGLYYVLILVTIIAITAHQIRKKRAWETVAYVAPCVINFFSLGFVNLARYSYGTGISMIGLLEMVEENFSKRAKIFIYICLLLLSVKLYFAYYLGDEIVIG